MADHDHDYIDWKLYPITRVHKDYEGTAGDKAFLTRVCKCGKVKAVDYGKTSQMRQKLAAIIGENYADSF